MMAPLDTGAKHGFEQIEKAVERGQEGEIQRTLTVAMTVSG